MLEYRHLSTRYVKNTLYCCYSLQKMVDFAFETTLSGKLYVNLFESLKKRGYKVHIFFLWVPDSDLVISRIKSRVAQGGHDVPVRDVLRRFNRSISNFFKLYRPLADSWMLFGNAGVIPILIAEKKNSKVKIINESLYEHIIEGIGSIWKSDCLCTTRLFWR